MTVTFGNLGAVPLTNLLVQPFNAGLATGRVDRLNEHEARLNVDALTGALPPGPSQIGQFTFTALTNAITQVIPLFTGSASGQRNGGELVSRSFTTNGQIVVVGSRPSLEPQLSSNREPFLLLYGLPSNTYTLNYTTNLGHPTLWLPWDVTTTNFINLLQALPTNSPSLFFRSPP